MSGGEGVAPLQQRLRHPGCPPPPWAHPNLDRIKRLRPQLEHTGIAPTDTLIVMEAMSTYWVALAVTLQQAGYVVSVINP